MSETRTALRLKVASEIGELCRATVRRIREVPIDEISRASLDASLYRLTVDVDAVRSRVWHEPGPHVYREEAKPFVVPGAPSSCEGCRWWSQRLARTDEDGEWEAHCFNRESPRFNGYAKSGCGFYEPGTAVDDR